MLKSGDHPYEDLVKFGYQLVDIHFIYIYLYLSIEGSLTLNSYEHYYQILDEYPNTWLSTRDARIP
jgi:hypothetical protein